MMGTPWTTSIEKNEFIFWYVFQAPLTIKGRTYSRRIFLASLATSFKNEIWSEISAGQFFLQVNSPVRRVGHVCRFGETLKTVIHKVAAAAIKDNLLARIWEILGSHCNIKRTWGSLFLDSNCVLSLCFNYREVVQQLIEEYQAATRADYIMWGTQQQVS